ncbi:DUF3060 domain-containing protein [Mycolicibacterium arseniciresistens]|uniref:DUF3060 domain-containing protein n=1 Tax=Mycolicibacterium arseniciresistens TaxID=3062257 RepID=A0ABT8U9C8_9MYCO|nr:DUF3060 domain-containing protein [Mycolicibacterium arseniciresistens]MDO3634398.1 DUF3060 domain-containing protein [Mycolicibacterium arseniciresistens]
MDPNDDPEARIRDLERPLADRAHNSELGTQSYSTPYPTDPYTTQPYTNQQQYYPPPPPPPGYPAPYSMAPTVPHSSSKAGWAVFAAVVVMLVIAGAGALIYFAMRPADGPSSGNPTVAGGGGLLDEPQIPQIPSMPVLPSGIPGLPTGLPGMPGTSETLEAGPGESVNVSGVQTVTTVNCDDGTVNVSGVANVVTITGECAAVIASGVNNEITVDSSAQISASGFDNTIIYKSGSPEIGFVTDSNVIRQG